MALVDRKDTRLTHEDYLAWPDDERWEIIDGKAYCMTPAPSFKHQRIVGAIYRTVANALAGGPCVVGIAPTDVVLSDHDVVQPDVFVVCDQKKINDQNIRGAPDLVVEVMSPATARKDRWEKKGLYERTGVLEYILVDPDGRYVERYLLDADGRFDRGEVFSPDQVLLLKSIESIALPIYEIFGLSPPPSEDSDRQQPGE